MKPFPTDPMSQYQHWFDAMLLDWTQSGKITRDTPRANAVLEITRQMKSPTMEAGAANNCSGDTNGK